MAMNFLRIFNNLFPSPPSEKMIKQRREKVVGTILSRYSEGNINLNRGRYFPTERAKALKKKALSFIVK